MTALLWMLLVRRQKLRQKQNDGGQEPLGRIIEECILSMVGVSLRADDRLCEDLGILLRFSSGTKIIRLRSGNVHIAVDECQQVVAIRAGGVAQVNDGDMFISIVFLGDGAVVTGKVALGIQSQKADT